MPAGVVVCGRVVIILARRLELGFFRTEVPDSLAVLPEAMLQEAVLVDDSADSKRLIQLPRSCVLAAVRPSYLTLTVALTPNKRAYVDRSILVGALSFAVIIVSVPVA